MLKFKCIPIGIHFHQMYSDRDTFSSNVSRAGYIEVNVIIDQQRDPACDQNVTHAGGVIVAWCFEAHFLAIPGNLLLVCRKFLKSSCCSLQT